MNPNRNNRLKEITKRIIKDRAYRIELAKRSFYWFFLIYFNHYVKYPMAKFHKEIFSLAEDLNINLVIIVAFRGSAKSTIISLGYPIWAILGNQRKRFPLLVCFTQQRAQETLSLIRIEFEKNELLNYDFGSFSQSDLWRDNTLAISKYQAKITAVSTNENIRGIRNRNIRPDLIICDDIEDVASTKTKEGREKGWQFLNSEIFPTGDKNTKKIIIGNLVHEDSIVMRLKKAVDEKKIFGVFKAYPLITKNNEVMWKEKFPTIEDVQKFKKEIVANEIDWQREYLLRILPSTEQIIYREWIKFYDQEEIPERKYHLKTGVGIDLAIKQTETSDYTSMVVADSFRINGKPFIFIHPYPFNKKITFPQTIDEIKNLCQSLGGRFSATLYVESVAYQASLVQQLESERFYAEEVKIGIGKRERLIMISSWIRDGKILFPKYGSEELIQQILNFGVEPHDDLVDAFTIVCSKLMEELTKPIPQIWFI
jgi:predicted phage terminase large subunit-like protein